MIGGLTTHRPRPRKKRVPMLRAYPAVHRGGVIACGRGAWVKEAGTDGDKRFDPHARLARNIGDGLVVQWPDGEAAAIVTGIEGGWRESWTVRAAGIPDGAVWVMGGPKA